MSASIKEREAMWDEFLSRWPLEKLRKITLKEYSQAGNPDCFTFGWLEQKTENLGSIWGGSAFKFGIYSRKDQSENLNSSGRSYSSEYGWYSKYGNTPEEAFDHVRTIIVNIAEAAQSGDLVTIESADLGSAIKWKLAFLYQNRLEPMVLPVYSAEFLKAYLQQTSKTSLSQMHTAILAKRGDIDLLAFGQNVWEQAEARLSDLLLGPQEALDFFQDNPERFIPIKSPTENLAGFTTVGDRSLAVSLKQKEAKLWLEPGSWLEIVKENLKDIKIYQAEDSRSSNLSANAPALDKGNPAIFVTVPTLAALLALCDAYDEIESNNLQPKKVSNTVLKNNHEQPLNQILFGPPGTGKTYSTIESALKILDPEFLVSHPENPNAKWDIQCNRRKALKERFDDYIIKGKVRFVTFHQSFSYEDFVEGLRAQSNSENQIEYKVEDGVFKQLCDAARTFSTRQKLPEISENPRIWKISIDGTGVSSTRQYCLEQGEARIGWGETGSLSMFTATNQYFDSLGSNDKNTLRTFAEEIAIGDILVCISSATEIGAIGVVTGNYYYDSNPPSILKNNYNHVLPVSWLYPEVAVSILPLNDNKRFTLKTVYLLDRFSWGDLLMQLEKTGNFSINDTLALSNMSEPHVLIVDEINRGNISRIFGELITLIEPSKRSGANEALEVLLPYSKKSFNVPSNVYLIGTMNTADRTLTSLDIALRRRFTFKEMSPRPELLDDIIIKEGVIQTVNIGDMLRKMNERIKVLLDQDHCIGHAYFMPLKDDCTLVNLAFIFRQQILPLLQEYFFEDWERIAWILNDQNKSPEFSFVHEMRTNLTLLFDSIIASSLQNSIQGWYINESAFSKIESYQYIIGNIK